MSSSIHLRPFVNPKVTQRISVLDSLKLNLPLSELGSNDSVSYSLTRSQSSRSLFLLTAKLFETRQLFSSTSSDLFVQTCGTSLGSKTSCEKLCRQLSSKDAAARPQPLSLGKSNSWKKRLKSLRQARLRRQNVQLRWQ